MRLHDRLVLRLFLRVVLFCALSFIVIFVLADLFEKIDNFIDHQASMATVARFYLYKLPDIFRLTLPVDLLLATLFTLGVLAKNNEIVALLASGVSMVRIGAPILAVGVLAAGLSALLNERIVPESNARMRRIKRVEIEKRPPLDAPVRHDFTYRGAGGFLYHVRVLNTEARTLKGVTVHQVRDGQVVARLDADRAEWRDGLWEFHDGYYRTFEPRPPGAPAGAPELAPGERAEAFRVMRLPELQETPEDLARIEPDPDAMNYTQLRRHADRVRASGGAVNDFVVDLYAKQSDPFTCLVLTVLGVGLSARKRKSNLAAGFGLTLVIGFTYLALSQIFAALGKNEQLPPALAAWLCQILFGAAGLLLLLRANR